MAKEDNLKPFTSERQPANRGRKKGVPNRATILKKWLKLKTNFPNQNGQGQKIFEQLETDLQITAEDKVVLSLIAKAWQGDVAAIREVMDTMYGKLTEKHELGNPDGSGLLDPLLNALDKAYGDRKG